jgi:nucleoside-diphosphate-sugar epimerase
MTSPAVSVVTGGAGFIGSNLVYRLLTLGHRVIVVDNLITGKMENLTEAKENPLFSYIQANVIEGMPEIEGATHVWHLASPASVIDYQNNPEETALVNSVGTRNALIFAKKHNARFLYTSTSEVYGDPKIHPQVESYWGNVNPNGIRSCYDESKRYGEMMTMLYHTAHGVDTRIVRIFNTYGPRMKKDDGRVVSNFVNQALEGKPLTVYGDGAQTRSLCFISDQVAGLVAFMESDKANGEVINIGNPEEYTMIDLAKKIIELTASKSEIIYEALPKDDPVKRKPDITKAQTILGWAPVVSVDEGLQKTIAYYKANK